MTKRVVSNHMVAHLWANQSQDHAHNASYSVSFNGRFYSSYRTAVARITDAYLGDKQVVLIADNHWGVTTARHIHNAHNAIRDHDQYHIMNVYGVQSRTWGEAEQIPHTINIKTMFEAYQKHCERLCKPSAYFWGYINANDEHISDTLANRERAIYAYARPFREYCMAFQYEEPYPNFDYWIARLRGAWARYYDPATANAREARDAGNRLRAAHAMAWAHAYLEGVAPKSQVYLRHVPARWKCEIERSIRAYENLYRPSERITPEQWMNGEGSSWYTAFGYGFDATTQRFANDTLLRRKGDVLQTSRGAEVPWQDAVRAFRMASNMRCAQREYLPQCNNGLGGNVGGFRISRVEANGDLHVGCHHLRYDEMQRLAIREAPEVVRPCYPVPAQYAGDYRGLPMDPPSLAHLLAERPRGFKCGDAYCSHCGDKYDGDYQCD